LIAYQLAKAGYWGGNPEAILEAKADTVMETYFYEIFLKEYEKAFMELNKE
jgi:hypothetical protein